MTSLSRLTTCTTCDFKSKRGNIEKPGIENKFGHVRIMLKCNILKC